MYRSFRLPFDHLLVSEALLASVSAFKLSEGPPGELRILGISGSAFLTLAKQPAASLLSLSSRQFYVAVIVFPDKDPEAHKGVFCTLDG